MLTAHDASWDAYFLGLGTEPLKVTYEELASSTESVVLRVLEHLGIPPPEDLALPTPRLTVQADAISEDWVRRVQEHLIALELPRANELKAGFRGRRGDSATRCPLDR